MKKLLSITLTALLVLFASQAFGQSESDAIHASAEVQTAIQFANIQNVDFGTISDNENSILNPTEGNLTEQNVGADASLGSIEITGGGSATISWDNATLAEVSDNTSTLNFVPTITDGSTTLNSGSSELTLSDSAITLSIGGELEDVATEGAGSYDTNNDGGEPLVITLQYTSN